MKRYNSSMEISTNPIMKPILRSAFGAIFMTLLLCVISTQTAFSQEIMKVAEQQAEPVGGLRAFYEYIKTNQRYPDEARQKNVEGRVHVKFIVNADGSLSNVEVTKGIGSGCDEEAIRLVQNAPKWSPARNGGNIVRMEVSRPIEFKLK
jgi:periplasmic protein TonB